MDYSSFVIIPIIGYAGLWVLASPLFVCYFKLFHVVLDIKHAAHMVGQIPRSLAIVTVPICSFASFFITTRVVSAVRAESLTVSRALEAGVVALAVTIVLDLLITVLAEKIDIRKFPLNLMYLLAYLVIIPAVLLGRSR